MFSVDDIHAEVLRLSPAFKTWLMGKAENFGDLDVVECAAMDFLGDETILLERYASVLIDIGRKYLEDGAVVQAAKALALEGLTSVLMEGVLVGVMGWLPDGGRMEIPVLANKLDREVV